MCPIHINAPFEEPLYDFVPVSNVDVRLEFENCQGDGIGPMGDYLAISNKAKRKIVLVGVNQPNIVDQKVLESLANVKFRL